METSWRSHLLKASLAFAALLSCAIACSRKSTGPHEEIEFPKRMGGFPVVVTNYREQLLPAEVENVVFPLYQTDPHFTVVPIAEARALLIAADEVALWDGRARRGYRVPTKAKWDTSNWVYLNACPIGNRVLVAGYFHGHNNHYDPLPKDLLLLDPTGAQPPLTGMLQEPRLGAPAMVAVSETEVLVTGGLFASGNTAELVRVTTQGMTSKRLPDMKWNRESHIALRLADGRVMVLGGQGNSGTAVEIFDPNSHLWTEAAPLQYPLMFRAALLLPDGRVFAVTRKPLGYAKLASYLSAPMYAQFVEIWDPRTGSWTQHDGPHYDRWGADLLLLDPQHVMSVGGKGSAISEIFDLRSSSWHEGPRLNAGRDALGALRISDKEVHLFAGNTRGRGTGGGENEVYENNVEVLSLEGHDDRHHAATSGQFVKQVGPSAARLGDGNFLFGGGIVDSKPSRHAELLDPLSEKAQLIAELPDARYGHRMFGLRDGSVALLGGFPTLTAPGLVQPLPGLRWLPKEDRWLVEPELAPDGAFYWDGEPLPATQLTDGSIVFFRTTSEPNWVMHTRALRWNPATGKQESIGELRNGRVKFSALTLADGRVLVGGGEVQPHVIALDKACTACPDEYVSFGRLESARSSEIYDPATGKWSEGPVAKTEGGKLFRLEDGRVAKIGETKSSFHEYGAKPVELALELADAAVTRWKGLYCLPSDSVSWSDMQPIGNRLLVSFNEEHGYLWDPDRRRLQEWHGEQDLEMEHATWRGIFTLDGRHILLVADSTPSYHARRSIYRRVPLPSDGTTE